MRLLYIGDIMGTLGVQAVSIVLRNLKSEESIDIVCAQAENVTNGKGISSEDLKKLKELGIDFFTGGNWTLYLTDIEYALNDPSEPIIRPANYPEGTAGLGYKYLKTKDGPILFISLLGQIVGRDADRETDNPLQVVDTILAKEKDIKKIAVIVNFHGDYSSEKVVIGHYLDGRVTAAVGDHWHVPTADARVLLDVIVNRWRGGLKIRNELEANGPLQFNAVLIDIDTLNGFAKSIKQIQRVIN